ncbi:4418_t:CDS:2 [Racocetra fulgida]|uniref:4418_t:CDS:1 n=1 Tax=Racocetra fulgida TaxID=60492 RepID=A0A9N8ZI29_9GLOM|nr:4418_t:CDS:2 [Racocetra fulgida]
MSNEGESLQASKFEDEEEKIEMDPKPTKPHNGKKIEQLLLSPDRKYAVTVSEDYDSMCGWQLNKDQPAEPTEDESYQPILFEFVDSIDFKEAHKVYFESKYPTVYAVSNNKSVVIEDRKRFRNLELIEFISTDEAEWLLLFYRDTFDVRDPYNLQHNVINDKPISRLYTELLSEKALTKLDISNVQIKSLMNERIYCISDGCLWAQEVSKNQWIKYLQEKLQDFDKIRVLPNKHQIEEILKKLINKNKDNESIRLKNLLDKIQNGKTLLPAPDLDFFIYYEQSNHFLSEGNKSISFKDILDELLNDYIEDNTLMKLYGQELLKFTKIQNDKWDDDTIEAPFLPNSLLKMLGKAELTPEPKAELTPKLVVEKEVFQKLEESEKLIQELKNIFEIKIE